MKLHNRNKLQILIQITKWNNKSLHNLKTATISNEYSSGTINPNPEYLQETTKPFRLSTVFKISW